MSFNQLWLAAGELNVNLDLRALNMCRQVCMSDAFVCVCVLNAPCVLCVC